MDTVERAQDNGGGSGRTYNRVTSGEHGGEFSSTNQAGASSTPTARQVYAPRPKKGGGAAKEQPKAPSSSKFKTLAPGEDNDGQAVAEMQQLLTALGLGNLTSGQYDADTENAVKEAQRRLGIKPNGKANKALVNKMLNAYDLSPCVKRADDPDPSDLIRSDPLCEFTVSRSEDLMFETLRAAVAEPDEDDIARSDELRAYTHDREPETHTPGHAPCCPDVLEDESHVFRREFALDGIDILRSGQGGDGRTVEAYATVFDSPTEVKDQHGHYMETIHRSAFDDVLRGGISRVKCFYNHGMNMNGSPSDRWSVPIGTPLEVRADGKGLRTVTRFNQGADADQILEAIRNNAITGYSFRGPIKQSDPPRIPRARNGMGLPTVTRMKLGLTEYGPTAAPYYADAKVLALRSRLSTLDPHLWDRLVDLLSTSTPEDQEALRTTITATPASGPGAEDQPHEALRSAADIARRIRVARILKGMT